MKVQLEQKVKKKVHAFNLNPEVVLQLKKKCKNKYSMSYVIEKLIIEFIHTRR